MPIPRLDEHGFLPPGVHDCTLEEIKERFAVFQESDRRPTLFRKLENLVAEIRVTNMARWLVIDGSFVTAKADPNDIDLILVIYRYHDVAADLLPSQYNL